MCIDVYISNESEREGEGERDAKANNCLRHLHRVCAFIYYKHNVWVINGESRSLKGEVIESNICTAQMAGLGQIVNWSFPNRRAFTFSGNNLRYEFCPLFSTLKCIFSLMVDF